ncbi:hypothetical protein U0L90_14265 [Flavobacteriaceae sp. LMIT009]
MFTLIRKIRKKLIEQGKLRNYLFYAVGEIILVVIGILIALQINSLNQKKLDKDAATNVLDRLIQDVDADYNRLKYIDSTYTKNLENISEVYKILAMDKIESPEQLEKVAFFSGADIKDVNSVRATFDEMINTGSIYKLENQSLIAQTIEYYRLVDDNTYQSREDRREFRNLFYGPELLDYWYIRSSSKNNLELAKKFFSDNNSDSYKRIVQSSNWSGGLISRGKNRNTLLIEKNRALKNLLELEIK